MKAKITKKHVQIVSIKDVTFKNQIVSSNLKDIDFILDGTFTFSAYGVFDKNKYKNFVYKLHNEKQEIISKVAYLPLSFFDVQMTTEPNEYINKQHGIEMLFSYNSSIDVDYMNLAGLDDEFLPISSYVGLMNLLDCGADKLFGGNHYNFKFVLLLSEDKDLSELATKVLEAFKEHGSSVGQSFYGFNITDYQKTLVSNPETNCNEHQEPRVLDFLAQSDNRKILNANNFEDVVDAVNDAVLAVRKMTNKIQWKLNTKRLFMTDDLQTKMEQRLNQIERAESLLLNVVETDKEKLLSMLDELNMKLHRVVQS